MCRTEYKMWIKKGNLKREPDVCYVANIKFSGQQGCKP